MSTPSAFVGASKTMTFSFLDDASPPAAADPTAITLTIREPDGVEIVKTQADMTNPVVGTWKYVHAVAKEGRHFGHVDGDGVVEAADQFEFFALRKVTA